MSMFKRKSPSELQEQLTKLKGASGFSEADKNEFKVKTDKDGNGSAVIRFLPGKGDDALPFIKLVNHFFKKGNSYYAENCTSTHGVYEDCPVCAYIKENNLYDLSQEKNAEGQAAKKLYSDIKRKTSYWANVLVIKDPANPDNEGKVMKFRFGIKIMEKIQAEIQVDESLGEQACDVTCPWEGKNFLLKVKQYGGFPNYDDSKFLNVSAIEGIDNEQRQTELFEGMTDLMAMIAKDQFKSFEENKKTFDKVMGTSAMRGATTAATAAASIDAQMNSFDAQMDAFKNDQDDLDDLMGSSTTTTSEGNGGDDIDDILNML